MNDAPRRTLRELIARHGPGLCSDARRCEGLLRDLCGEHRREINILVGALRDRVPLDLLAGRNSLPKGLLLTRLARGLEDHLALTEGAAAWAVETWALALGVVSDAELEEIKGRRDEAAAPRVGPTAATRPAAEEETTARSDTARSNTRPVAPPPLAQQSPAPRSSQKPSATNQAGPRPAAPKATRPATQGGSSAAARRYPSPPAAPAPLSPRAANTGPLQAPPAEPAPRGGRRRRWRGCLVGCVVLLLLAGLLMAVAPFVLDVLREEQQQRNLEPPFGQTR